MRRFIVFISAHQIFIFGLMLVLLGLGGIYRGVFLNREVLFPANLLASVYSPWSTMKFDRWPQGIPFKPIGGNDQVRLFYPGRTLSNESIQSGHFPLWNPYIFSGSPHIANFQSAVFYPLNIFYFFMPQIDAWSMITIMPFILGFIGTYVFLRSISCTKEASIIGGIAFAFCGYIATWSQENAAAAQSALWLPFILFGIHALIHTRKYRYMLLLVGAIAASFLGGFMQITFYALALSFCYGIFEICTSERSKKVSSILLLISFIAGILICSVQLLPSAEAFKNSSRGETSVWYLFEDYLLPVTFLFHIFYPDLHGNPGTYSYFSPGFYHEKILYIGVIPLIFVFFALFGNLKNKYVRFFTAGSALTILLTIVSPFTIWFFHLPVPLITTFLPSRIFYLSSFCLAVLAALGITLYQQNSYRQTIKQLLIAIATVVFFMSIPLLYVILGTLSLKGNHTGQQLYEQINIIMNWKEISPNFFAVMQKNIILPLLFLISGTAVILFPWRKKTIYILIVLCAVGQFYFLYKYAVLGRREFIYPDHFIFDFLHEKQEVLPIRFLAFGKPIIGNVASPKKMLTPEGLDAVFPYRYGQLTFATRNEGTLIKDIPRIEVVLSDLSEPDSILRNRKRLRLASLLGVKYFFFHLDPPLTEKDLVNKFPSDRFPLLWKRDNWYAYENTYVLPRAFFAQDYKVLPDGQEMVNAFFAEAFDPRKTILLEENVVSDLSLMSDTPVNGKVTTLSYENERIVFETATERDALLFLSDNDYPGWEARVDGLPTKIYRANYTFRAVTVPKGNHVVSFEYKPISFRYGLSISLITGLILIVISTYKLIRRTKYQGKKSVAKKLKKG